jgi:hypothetical protein
MLLTRIKVATVVMLAAGVLGWGTTEYSYRAEASGQPGQSGTVREPPKADSPRPAPQGRRPKSAEEELLRKLDKRVSVKFDNVPLKQVLDDLRAMAGLNIVVNEAALDHEGLSVDANRVTIQLDSVSLKTVLQYILQNARMDYAIEDQVVVVSVNQGRLITRVYRVADLLGKDTERRVDKLVKVIRLAVDPKSWVDAGGKGTVDYAPLDKALIVSQTAGNQERVHLLLEALHELLTDRDKE